MKYEEIVAQAAEATGYSKKLVDRTYRAFWKAVRVHIKSLPLKEEMTEEEFMKLQPNVNIPSIGKLYVTYDRYKRIKKQNRIIRELRERKSKN